MALAKDYQSVMGRSNEIQKEALGLDYSDFETSPISFDYDALMKSTGYTLDEIERIQGLHGVGNTPLLELRNITKLARKYAKPGYGARMNPATHPALLRTDVRRAQLRMRRN